MYLTFFSETVFTFWNQHEILDFFFQLNMTYLKKKIHLSEGPFFKFLDTKPKIREKPLKMKKIPFLN
jgi:hypothetical protein